jgi:isoleucyl-tRNA synthetase
MPGRFLKVLLATCVGASLAGATYSHPLYPRTNRVVVGGDYVTIEAGTGLVRTAPGQGR